MKKKIIVGMSGGVDSSVVAALLLKQGYEVEGATMKVWKNTQDLAVVDAQLVAKKLGIKHHVFDLRDIFSNKVVESFINTYLIGKTPNPCITCNRYIKFNEFLQRALALGADYVATGHYAKVEKVDNRYLLKKSASLSKDQTYPLYNLKQEQLAYVIFPLAEYEKIEVRKIAQEFDLPVANKAESQDICFVLDQNYAAFIEEQTGVKMKPGNFVDKSGNILGRHKGIYHYTIGQRKGLGVATGEPVFVCQIDVGKNEIVLGNEADILSQSFYVTDLNFITVDSLDQPIEANVKIRYGAKEVPASLIPIDQGRRLQVICREPQRAVTKGQSAVFYQNDLVLGGGVIE